VIAVVTENIGCTTAARQFGLRNSTVRRMLLIAFDQWPDFYQYACDELDEEDPARIHAHLNH